MLSEQRILKPRLRLGPKLKLSCYLYLTELYSRLQVIFVRLTLQMMSLNPF